MEEACGQLPQIGPHLPCLSACAFGLDDSSFSWKLGIPFELGDNRA